MLDAELNRKTDGDRIAGKERRASKGKRKKERKRAGEVPAESLNLTSQDQPGFSAISKAA